MKTCIGVIHDKPMIIEVKDGLVYLNDELMPIKNITEEDVQLLNDQLDSLPKSDDPGIIAKANSYRAPFIVKLIGNTVGEDSIDRLSHILDHVHYDVLKYLGEVDED